MSADSPASRRPLPAQLQPSPHGRPAAKGRSGSARTRRASARSADLASARTAELAGLGAERRSGGLRGSPPRADQTALRRVLARARDGKALDPGEAAILLHARGEQLTELLSYAARVRDAGLAAAGRPGIISYSRKVFIPLTRLCRDRCAYCTFVTVPGRLDSPVPVPGRGAQDRRGGGGAGLQGGAVHAGRPARGALAAGPRVAGRARLRRHAVLRPGHGHPGAGGDRAAAAPEPRRAQLAGLPAAQAGRAVHGHDAGDHRGPAVHRARRAALRQPGQGPRGPAPGAGRTRAGAACRSPPGS